ncbi:MAG: M20/M25/M40 family metallo-hydrolase [Phycisphaerales bacterium]|jgi:hypothetical protein|nr:M20/M25/M40 family metallo-hydrolase [Phycisphaerales bacterium]
MVKIESKTRISGLLCTLLMSIPLIAGSSGCISSPRLSAMPAGAPTARETILETELKAIVTHLATEIGPRSHVQYDALKRSANWIEAMFKRYGYAPTRQNFVIKEGYDEVNGREFTNVIAELRGTKYPDEIIVIGSHYDTVHSTPGADDNASGVAATLALARHFSKTPQERTIRFVAFTNEEPPFFQTENMGSLRYARACEERGENIIVMITPEMIGYFDETPGSQEYPHGLGGLLPDTGNYIALVSNCSTQGYLDRALSILRKEGRIPAGSAQFPESMVPYVGFSDNWSFWQIGVPAFMVTDMSLLRNKNYHTDRDTPMTLDYVRMARVVAGLIEVTKDLATK